MSALNEINWDDSGRLEGLLPGIDPAVASVLDRALKGEELDFGDGLRLARTTGYELEALVLAADQIRRDRVGDVITYVPPGNVEPVTHRLISRKNGKKGGPVFRTKGDNNAVVDPRKFQLNKPRQARYAFSVPYLGWLFIALGNAKMRFILLAIPALLIALSMLAGLWREGGQLAAQREAA